MILYHKDIHINDVDEAIHLYIIDHKRKFEVKCDLKSVFNDYDYCPYVASKFSDNKTMISWKT